MEEYGTSGLNVLDTQLIACLDIRTMNQDRHGANILVTAARGLVPIDHGFSLPSFTNIGKTTFFWSSWPQIRHQPPTKEVVALVESLDSAKDAVLLRQCGIDESSILSMRIGTKLLKVGIKKGLTLGSIADLCLRSNPETTELSAIEQLIKDASSSLSTATNIAGSSKCVACNFAEGCYGYNTCKCRQCQLFNEMNFESLFSRHTIKKD